MTIGGFDESKGQAGSFSNCGRIGVLRGDSAVTKFLTSWKMTGRVDTSNTISNWAVVFIIGTGTLNTCFSGADGNNFGGAGFNIVGTSDAMDAVVDCNSTGLGSLFTGNVICWWVICFGGVVGVGEGERVGREDVEICSKFDRSRGSGVFEDGAILKKKWPFVIETGVGFDVFRGDKGNSERVSSINYSDEILD